MSRMSLWATLALLSVLALSLYPNAYASWGYAPSTQIAASHDSSGNAILTIHFDFYHWVYRDRDENRIHHSGLRVIYPNEFQVRTSSDGITWTVLAPVPLSPPNIYEGWRYPTSVTVTYNLGSVSGPIRVEARLEDRNLGWSIWEPQVPIVVQ